MAVSRRALLRGNVLDWFVDPLPMRETLLALQRNEVTSGRFEAQLKRAPLGSSEPLLVRVTASQMDTADRVLLEMIEIEQQTRQDREERALGLAQANKELVRNLAHEIKNPLGGIRGAAQLLEMELDSRSSTARACAARSASAAARRARRGARPDRIHPGHHPRGRPTAGAGRPAAGAAPQAACGGRRQHPRGLRARAPAHQRRVPARPGGAARLRHLDPRIPRRPRAADPGGAEHRAQRHRGAGRADRRRQRAPRAAHAHRAAG